VAAVLCVLVAMQSGIERTELTQAANKAATLPAVPGESTQPANPAATKKLFAYLSADSYTPQNEQSFLATRLGVDDATKNAQSLKERQVKKGKVPVAQEKEPDYNVPYFTQFLVPKQPHFTRGGMHAAASQAEKAREKAGFVDDDGVHYLGKDNAEKLAKELAKTEASYLFSENGGIVWRSPEEEARFKAESEHKAMKPPAPVKHLDRAQDQVLARDLEAGIAYATLPNHGVPIEKPRYAKVDYKAGKKLAQELEVGEQEALAFQAAQAVREEEVKQARSHVRSNGLVSQGIGRAGNEKLAAELREGQREALLGPFGYKSKGAVKPLHRMPVRAAMAKQRTLQALWHMPKKPRNLTPAQDRNVAQYLEKGIKRAFPAPKPVVHRFLSKEAGEKLVAAAKLDEKAEIKKWSPPAQKFVARRNGMRLAAEMERSLRKENRAGGQYVDKYLHRVTGKPLRGPQRPRYVMDGSNEGEMWYQDQLGKREALGSAWEHKQQARKYRQEHEKYLNPSQMRALRDYMQPALHVGKGVAPGLGFAV